MRHVALAVASGLLIAGTAWAQAKPSLPPVPPAMGRVIDCTKVAEATARLACFDKEVAAMRAAQQSGQLVAMDRQQVSKTRRSLFGLALPDLGIFGDDVAEDDAPSSIETTLRAVDQTPRGKWIFVLKEGGRWEQLDSREFVVDPAPGQKIRIRRAALGSYLANVNDQIAVRVRRIR